MRLADIKTVFEAITEIKLVIADGRGIDNPKSGDRNLLNVPYVELIESFDYTEHSSTTRIRKGSITGRIIAMKERDDPNALMLAVETKFTEQLQSQLHITFSGVVDFSSRLIQIPFSITYFDAVDKT